jgi:predicted MFS family arabinose efflux permease
MSERPTLRTEFSNGWLLLLTATLGCGMGASSLVYYSFGVFVEPLQQHFQWSRGEVTSTLLYGSLGLVLIAPLLGWMIDRVGPRRVALIAIPAFSALLFVASRFDASLVLFYGLFFFTTLAGSGTTPILYTRAVAGHFDAARGIALGITLTGPGSAAILLPPFMTGVIAESGWRAGFEVLAWLALTPWLLVLLFFGDRRSSPARKTVTDALPLSGVTRREALSSRPFWTIVLGFGAVSVGCSATVVHLIPLLRDAGLAAAEAASVAAVIGIGVVLGRLVIGWAIDHFFAPRVATVIFLIAAFGCLLLIVGGTTHARIAALLIGFALGAEVDLLAYLTSRYFGLRHYGFLYAVIYAFFWTGIAAGPALAGRLYDAFGGYDPALWMIAGSLVCGGLAAATLPRFERCARLQEHSS